MVTQRNTKVANIGNFGLPEVANIVNFGRPEVANIGNFGLPKLATLGYRSWQLWVTEVGNFGWPEVANIGNFGWPVGCRKLPILATFRLSNCCHKQLVTYLFNLHCTKLSSFNH